MALTRLKSKPFTFTRTPNNPDAQYFRRELERALDFIDQQFSALTVSDTAATDIIPTSRGGFGINMSPIPQFGIPYATQPNKFGWVRSSAFSIGLLGRQSQAEWQTALGITSFGNIPQNSILGRYEPSTGPAQVAGLGGGLLFDGSNLRVTDALLAFSSLTAVEGDLLRYRSGMWGGQDLGTFFDDLIADPVAATYDYTELPFTFAADKRLLGRDGAASAEISIGSALLLTGGVLNTGPQLAAIEALTTTSYGIGLLEMADDVALRAYAGLGTSAVLDAGVALGTATLDAGGKVPLSQIPDSVLGQVEYQGSWNAATNTPTLSTTPGAGSKGYYYVTSVAGTFDGIDYGVGDWIISNGTVWEKVDNTDAVVSVAGRIGAINLFQADISGLTTADTPVFTSARLSGLTTNGVLRTTGGNGTLTVSAVLAASLGGTGQSTYADGDLLYGAAGNLAKLSHPGLLGYVLVTSFFGGLQWVDSTTLAVTTLTGTANQVLVNGTSGSGQTGNITLTTPQNIHTGATPQFAGLGIGVPAVAGTPLWSEVSLNGLAFHINRNTNTGNTARATNIAWADTAQILFQAFGSGHTGSILGVTAANVAQFAASSASRLLITTDNTAPIVFAVNNTEVGRLTGTGFQGAVGATTPNTGTFTTAAINSAGAGRMFHIAASSGYALATIESGGANQNTYLEFKPTGTGQAVFQVNATDLMFLSSTGINNTAIGATTPSTVAATAISASGAISSTASNGVLSFAPSTGTNAVYALFDNDGSNLFFGLENSSGSATGITGISAYDCFFGPLDNVNLCLVQNGIVRGKITSTGLNSMAIGATTPSTVRGTKLIGGGTTPSIAVAAAAGTGASATISGSDAAVRVVLTTGTTASAGLLFTVTFASAFAAAPKVVFTPCESDSASLVLNSQPYVIRNTTTFEFQVVNAPSDSTDYPLDFVIIG